MIETGEIDTKPWVTHRLDLADVPTQFAGLSGRPDLVKAVIEVSEELA
jgi:threonine dehydrogenase-like Zn-dependent dehydrogenase